MKGIPIFRLKRLKRTALLLGAGTLVAGASLLGAAQANAAVGTQPGALRISPATGTTATSMRYSTTIACPAGKRGSAVVRIISPTTGATTNMSVVNNSVATPFSGSLNATFAQAAAVFPRINGATSELAVYCFPSASAVGTPVAYQDTFVTINAAGHHYTISSSGRTTATATATPGGDTIPIGVTVASGASATPTATSATPAAAPATGGGTGPGSNPALAATGAAVVLAGGGLILLARQRRRQGVG